MINDFEKWLDNTLSICPLAGGRPYILLKRIEYPMRLSREQAIRMADKLWNLAVECPTLDEYLNPPTRGG